MSGSPSGAAAVVFDRNADEWAAWQASPWGRLRYRLVAHTLALAIAPLGPQCRILDVGGADGRDSVPLAQQGHHVTILDHSEPLLQRARAAADAARATDCVRTVRGDIGRLADLSFLAGDDGPANDFDVVICHNVLQYLPDVPAHVRRMVALVRFGGLLSVLAPNPAMDVLALAVRGTDPAGALARLDAPSVPSVTFGHQMRRLASSEVEATLMSCGATVTDRFGIRCVMDLIADEDLKSDPDFVSDLERLELGLCGREPYWRTARFWQLVAQRTSGETPGRDPADRLAVPISEPMVTEPMDTGAIARTREPNDRPLDTHLGRAGLEISRLALGTVNFGGRVEEPEAHALLDHALERGINVVDTANMYGWRVHKGYTEEVVGRWLAARPGRREEVVIATKVGNEMAPGRNQSGLSVRHVVAACEGSLRRLRTDWIDLYQMHRVDPNVGWDEVWQAMEMLVSQGKVRYVGSSNFAGWHLAAAQEAARDRRFLGLVSEQCIYNLVTRHAELEVIPAARAYGIAVLVWSPLHGGLLGGVLGKLRDGRAVKSAQGRAQVALEHHRDTIAAFEQLCAEWGRDPAAVGLAWVASRPGVTSIVIGPRTTEHVDSAIAALDVWLSDEEQARLEELFPPIGRGGPGPEAWAR